MNHNSPSWTQVRLRERTGPSTFGAATTLSPTTAYAANSMINRGGNAVVWDQANALRGNKIVGGSWADPDTGTTGFGTQTNSSDGQTSNDGSRTLWNWHNDDSSQYNVYASTWNADGTAGAGDQQQR